MTHKIPDAVGDGRIRSTTYEAFPQPNRPSPLDLIVLGLDRTGEAEQDLLQMYFQKHDNIACGTMVTQETWHEKCEEIARLQKTRDVCRAAIKLCYKHLTPEAYSRLVQKYTRWQAIDRWKLDEHGNHVLGRVRKRLHYRNRLVPTRRWYTKRQWMIVLASKKGVTMEQLAKYAKVIDYLNAHPDANTEKYRYAADFSHPVLANFDVVPPGFLNNGWYTIKLRERVRIPVRDWDRIRADWAAKRALADQASEPYRRKLRMVLDKLDPMFRELRTSFNVLQRVRCRRSYPLDELKEGEQQTLQLGFLGRPYPISGLPSRAPDTGWRELTEGYFMRRGTMYLFHDIPEGQHVNEWHHELALCSEVGQFVQSEGGGEPYTQPLALAWLPDCQWTGTLSVVDDRETYTKPTLFREWVSLAAEERNSHFRIAAKHVYPNILQTQRCSDVTNEFDAIRISKVAQLRAMRVPLHRRRVDFDVYRSIGELKDTPLLWRQAGELCRWWKQHRGAVYYEVTHKNGTTVRYITDAVEHPNLRARIIADLARPAHRRTLTKGLNFSNIVKVRKLRVVPTLSIAAALYLAWKFGIEQSITDARELTKGVKDAFYGSRKVLSRMESEILGSTGVATPRIRWQVCPKGAPFSRKRLPYMAEASFDREVIDDCFSWEGEWQSLLSGAPPPERPRLTSGHSVVKSDKLGLWAYSPFNSEGSTAADHEEIHLHNLGVLISNGLLPGPVRLMHRIVGGTLFTRLVYKTWKKLAQYSSSVSLLNVQPLKVAWELAPLSFIVDWISNVGDRIAAANDLFTATYLDLGTSPENFWETLTEEVRLSDPVSQPYQGGDEIGFYALGPSRVLTIAEATWHRSQPPHYLESHWSSISGNVYAANTNVRFVRPRTVSLLGRFAENTWTSFTRRPAELGSMVLPPLRLRFRITAGKIISFLSMLIAK